MIQPVSFDRPLLAFGAASLAAVVVGAAVCAMSGVPSTLWMRNIAAWCVGALAAAILAGRAGSGFLSAAVLLAPIGLAATLLNPGLEGVHRWLVAGPVRLNAAMLLLPSLVVATAVLAERRPWWCWIPAFAGLAVLALQPDASQATALALAICAIAASLRSHAIRARWALALAALAVAAFSWSRRDPLEPVPEVEEVIALAGSHSPLLAGLAVAVLVAFAAAPVLATARAHRADVRRAGVALSVLFSAWITAPALGAFPVPLVGIGLSPILGAWLGVGLLSSLGPRR